MSGVAESETHVAAAIRSYRDLDAWKAGMDLVLAAYELTARLPNSERFGLTAQIRRSAVSVPANVAEGQASGGRRYAHHVRIALGSLAELDTHVEAALRLSLLSQEVVSKAAEQIERTGKLLHGLSRFLDPDSRA